MSLQEAACHLLRHSETADTDTNACERLTHLRLRLQSLTRLTSSYLLKLGAVLGRDPVSHASLATLSHEVSTRYLATGTVHIKTQTEDSDYRLMIVVAD